CNRVSSRSCVRCCGNGVSTRLSYSARVCQRLPDQAGELVAEYLLYQQPYLSHICVSEYGWSRRLIALEGLSNQRRRRCVRLLCHIQQTRLIFSAEPESDRLLAGLSIALSPTGYAGYIGHRRLLLSACY